jgi:hypothetical protein
MKVADAMRGQMEDELAIGCDSGSYGCTLRQSGSHEFESVIMKTLYDLWAAVAENGEISYTSVSLYKFLVGPHPQT